MHKLLRHHFSKKSKIISEMDYLFTFNSSPLAFFFVYNAHLIKKAQFLKITQNVAFEFFNFPRINFCPIQRDLSGNTVWPQATGFQKLVKMDHSKRNATFCGIFKHCFLLRLLFAHFKMKVPICKDSWNVGRMLRNWIWIIE